MDKFRNYLLPAAGLLTLVLVLSFANVPSVVSDKLQNVMVVNPMTKPAAVRDVENPSRQPFQKHVEILVRPGESAGTRALPVPTGKRLVIEYVSGFGNSLPSRLIPFLKVTTTVDGNAVSHYVVGNPLTVGGFIVSQQVRLYADPNTRVSILAARPDASDQEAKADVSISGYVVDVP